MKMNLIHIGLFALFGLTISSCKKPANTAGTELDKNLIKSAEKYATLMQKRGDGPARFTIEDLKRDGNLLTIGVKGGCKEEDFNLVWDGVIAFSYPGQVNLVLDNDSQSDCGSDGKFSIKVNLIKILDSYGPENFIINVANGSVKQEKSLAPNGTVSTR